MNIDAKANKDDRIQMITVDTNIQAERFKFLKVEDPSLSKGLMDPFTEKNIEETILWWIENISIADKLFLKYNYLKNHFCFF